MSLLPNAEFAVVPIEKLTDYALNPNHPVGKHKAAVFESVFGITLDDAEYLKDRILDAVLTCEAVKARNDNFGQRYQVEFELERNGRRAIVSTSWILGDNDLFPRLTTCYIK